LIGTDGRPLPVLPPERDPRLSIRVIRVMFYTPGFLALLLLKAGEPTGFGITIELLMLASSSAVVAGLFIATQSSGGSADAASRVGTWSGALVLELLGVVPFLCAVPPLFHQLAHSSLLHGLAPGAVVTSLGHSEFVPAAAIIPFMVYQLAGFGTLHYVVPKAVNWLINILIFALILGGYIANRLGKIEIELTSAAVLVTLMVITAIYGVVTLKKMQIQYDAFRPRKADKQRAGKGDDGSGAIAAPAA
jgi:hypothetical protein